MSDDFTLIVKNMFSADYAVGNNDQGYASLCEGSVIDMARLDALASLLGHKGINIVSYEGTPGYSEYTPGDPGSVEIQWDRSLLAKSGDVSNGR